MTESQRRVYNFCLQFVPAELSEADFLSILTDIFVSPELRGRFTGSTLLPVESGVAEYELPETLLGIRAVFYGRKLLCSGSIMQLTAKNANWRSERGQPSCYLWGKKGAISLDRLILYPAPDETALSADWNSGDLFGHDWPSAHIGILGDEIPLTWPLSFDAPLAFAVLAEFLSRESTITDPKIAVIFELIAAIIFKAL